MGDLISWVEVRLIDANALEKHLINIANTMQDSGFESYAGAMGEAAAIVHSRPAVEAVEVVRCKDCVWRGNGSKCPMCHEEWFDDPFDGFDSISIDKTTDEGFCHYGARIGGEDEETERDQ